MGFLATHLIGFGSKRAAAAGGGTITSTFVANTNSTSDASSYTFSAASIGTAESNRIVVVAVWARSASSVSISSVTIGGVAATEIVTALGTGTAFSRLSIYALNVTSGTTADIVVNCSAGCVRAGIGVWRFSGQASPSTTAHATTTDTTASSNALSGTINIPAGGTAVAVSADGGGTTLTCVWTGATERYDTGVEGVNGFTGASKDSAIAITPETLTAQWSSTVADPVMVAASWAP